MRSEAIERGMVSYATGSYHCFGDAVFRIKHTISRLVLPLSSIIEGQNHDSGPGRGRDRGKADPVRRLEMEWRGKSIKRERKKERETERNKSVYKVIRLAFICEHQKRGRINEALIVLESFAHCLNRKGGGQLISIQGRITRQMVRILCSDTFR